MPINSLHPTFQNHLQDIALCSDFYSGEAAVKRAGTAYLPRLSGHRTDEEYLAYMGRAVYYNLLKRTVIGLIGTITRKDPEIKVPTGLPGIDDAAGKRGETLYELSTEILQNTLVGGRCGILVDRPQKAGDPYLALYPCQDVINWAVADDGAYTMVVLREYELVEATDDRFSRVLMETFRELYIEDGVYGQRVHRFRENGWVVEEMAPLRRDQRFEEIPFLIVTPSGVTDDMEPPPVTDLARVAVGHYRNSADIEHGRHLTALPTPYTTGANLSPGDAFLIGSGSAWNLPEKATAGMIEFSGAGLASLAVAMEEKESKMAMLGARMLEGRRPDAGVEAAETVRMRQSGESSTLVRIAMAAGAGLTKALQWWADWDGKSGEVMVAMNTDLSPEGLTSEEITALSSAYLQGSLSVESYTHQLHKGEMLPDGDTPEIEAARLKSIRTSIENIDEQ